MEIILHKKFKAKTLIEGFPGFGLVGTIVTEYLIEQLNCELIGEFVYDELSPTVAIHKGKLVNPMGVYYNKKYDLVILHAILDVKGFEWKIADIVQSIIKQLSIKETISIEGVAGDDGDKLYCFNNDKFTSLGAEPIKESVIMGVTASLLLHQKNVGCLFAPTKANIPDSRAAAKIIEFLDKYLGFELNIQPLLMQAEIFENKLKGIMQNTQKTVSEAEKKQMSYLG